MVKQKAGPTPKKASSVEVFAKNAPPAAMAPSPKSSGRLVTRVMPKTCQGILLECMELLLDLLGICELKLYHILLGTLLVKKTLSILPLARTEGRLRAAVHQVETQD